MQYIVQGFYGGHCVYVPFDNVAFITGDADGKHVIRLREPRGDKPTLVRIDSGFTINEVV